MGLKNYICSIAQGCWESCREHFNTHPTSQPSSAKEHSQPNVGESQSTESGNGHTQKEQKTKSLFGRLSRNRKPRSNQHGLRKGASLKLPQGVVSTLSDAVLEEREAQDKLSKLTTKCKSLHDAICQLDRRAVGFDVRAEELRLQDPVANSGQVETMRESARIVRAGQNRIRDKLRELEEKLDDVRYNADAERAKLYAVLDRWLVHERIISAQTEIAGDHSTQPQPQSNGAAAHDKQTRESNEQHITTSQRANEQPRKVLQRSAGQQNLRLMAANSPQAADTPAKRSEYVRDPKLEAERDYKYYRILVGQAEADFDDRQDRFDQERDQLMLKIAAGEARESMSQLDRRQFLETQKLTQRFARAEENYYAAKDAAVAAGVILGSDVESGFAPRPDDGYSLSMEVDGHAFVDRGRIERWLAMLPESNATMIHDEDSDAIGCRESGEDDLCELESVEMWETRSAIAEGPWRRRIDKWNSIRFSAACAK